MGVSPEAPQTAETAPTSRSRVEFAVPNGFLQRLRPRQAERKTGKGNTVRGSRGVPRGSVHVPYPTATRAPEVRRGSRLSRVLHLYGSLARSLGSVCGGVGEMLVDGVHGDEERVAPQPPWGIHLPPCRGSLGGTEGARKNLPACLASARGHVEHSEEYRRTVERIRCALSFFLRINAYFCSGLFMTERFCVPKNVTNLLSFFRFSFFFSSHSGGIL